MLSLDWYFYWVNRPLSGKHYHSQYTEKVKCYKCSGQCVRLKDAGEKFLKADTEFALFGCIVCRNECYRCNLNDILSKKIIIENEYPKTNQMIELKNIAKSFKQANYYIKLTKK